MYMYGISILDIESGQIFDIHCLGTQVDEQYNLYFVDASATQEIRPKLYHYTRAPFIKMD